MTKLVASVCFVALLSLAAPVAHGGTPVSALIDCDNGGDLARDVPRAVATGRTDIHVRGTCTGDVVIDAPGLTLRGDPTAIVQGVEGGPLGAIEVVGPVDLVIRDIEIRSEEYGVVVQSPGADVQILQCVIRDTVIGVDAQRGSEVRVWSSDIRENALGLRSRSGADLLVQTSTVEDNETGITTWDRASVGVVDSQIMNHQEAGITVRGRATATISRSQMSNNGDLHIFGTDRADIEVVLESVIGAAGDPTGTAAFAGEGSHLRIGSSSTVWGPVQAWSSRVWVFLATIHGPLTLERFSNGIVQGNATVEGGVVCQTGSDAMCTGPTPSATGCASTLPDCSTPPGAAESSSGEAESLAPRMPLSNGGTGRLRR